MALSVLIVVVNSILGCASVQQTVHSEFQTYVNQPYLARNPVLPKGIALWRPYFGMAVDETQNLLFHPLLWEHGLTERVTVIWSPLPLDLRVGIWQDGRDFWVGEFFMFGEHWGRIENFDWRPTLKFTWRRRWATNWSAQTSLDFVPEIKRKDQYPFAWSSFIKNEWSWSPVEWGSLLGGLAVGAEWGEAEARYLGALPIAARGALGQRIRWRAPIELGASLRILPGLELLLGSRWHWIGYGGEALGPTVYSQLQYYW